MTVYTDASGKQYPTLEITGTAAFVNEVNDALRQIHSVDRLANTGSQCSDPGPRLILGIARSGKKVTITSGNTFKATATGDTAPQFVQLRTSWEARRHDEVRRELRVALPKAGFGSIELFAMRVANSGFAIVDRAFSGAQVQGKSATEVEALLGGKAGNMLTPDSKTLVDPRVAKGVFTTKSGRATKEFNNRQGNVDNWVTTLKAYMKGTGNQDAFNPTDTALRTMLTLLEPGLTPSNGANAGVNYATNSATATCEFDAGATPRPKAIAFAHELIHAYYIVKGSRLFKESTVEDELLTAGMPPFHYRDISENRFRSNWATAQPVRQYYKFGTISLETACAFCGKMQSAMKRGAGGFEELCAGCGKPLPVRTQ